MSTVLTEAVLTIYMSRLDANVDLAALQVLSNQPTVTFVAHWPMGQFCFNLVGY
jgi:hypothetical protein